MLQAFGINLSQSHVLSMHVLAFLENIKYKINLNSQKIMMLSEYGLEMSIFNVALKIERGFQQQINFLINIWEN